MNAATKSPSKTIILTVILIAPAIGGCGTVGKWFGKSKPRQPTSAPAPRRHARTPVPDPINRLLPKTINIHPFTGTRTFDKADRIKGVDVRIEVLNALGQHVETLLLAHQQAGRHRITWDAEGAASGLYLLVVDAGGMRETMKMLLLR